jgi:hypothetical protein
VLSCSCRVSRSPLADDTERLYSPASVGPNLLKTGTNSPVFSTLSVTVA